MARYPRCDPSLSIVPVFDCLVGLSRHVQYGEQHAVLAIPSGNVLEGKIKPTKLRLVQAWIEIHRDELMADWRLAVDGQKVFKIAPLR